MPLGVNRNPEHIQTNVMSAKNNKRRSPYPKEKQEKESVKLLLSYNREMQEDSGQLGKELGTANKRGL